MTTARRFAAAGATLVVAGSLAACGAGEPELPSLSERQASSSPSPSESLSEEEATKQEKIAEAEAVLSEYRQLEFDVAHDGYGGWAVLAPYWGSDEIATSLAGFYRGLAADGRYSSGIAEVVSSEVSEYDGDNADYEKVEFTLCLNTSGISLFEEDGTQVPLPNDTPEQYSTVYRLSHTGPDGTWQLVESQAHTDRKC